MGQILPPQVLPFIDTGQESEGSQGWDVEVHSKRAVITAPRRPGGSGEVGFYRDSGPRDGLAGLIDHDAVNPDLARIGRNVHVRLLWRLIALTGSGWRGAEANSGHH